MYLYYWIVRMMTDGAEQVKIVKPPTLGISKKEYIFVFNLFLNLMNGSV
jgi:hypothetical protein